MPVCAAAQRQARSLCLVVYIAFGVRQSDFPGLNLIHPGPLTRPFVLVVLIGSLLMSLVMAFQARHRVYKRMLVGSHEGVNDFQRWMYLTPQFLAGNAEYDAT